MSCKVCTYSVCAYFHTKITFCTPNYLSKMKAQESQVYPGSPPRLHPCPVSRNVGFALPPTNEKPTARMFGGLTECWRPAQVQNPSLQPLSLGLFIPLRPSIHRHSWTPKVMVHFIIYPCISSLFSLVWWVFFSELNTQFTKWEPDSSLVSDCQNLFGLWSILTSPPLTGHSVPIHTHWLKLKLQAA